jgi:hypothetical protein
MSASLADGRATPKPPSSFWLPMSQRMVVPPAGSPAPRSARIPKAV